MDNNTTTAKKEIKLNTFGKVVVSLYMIVSTIFFVSDRYCLLGGILWIALYVFCQGGIAATIKKWQADELLLEPGEDEKKEEELL